MHAVWLGGAVGAMGRLCRGEARGTGPEDAAGKMRKMKPIKNFAQDMKLNGDIWEVAEEFAVAA